MFFVAGITGQVGGATARQVLADGHRIRTLARDPQKASGWAAKGVDVRKGDLDDPVALAAALEDVEGAFLLMPQSGGLEPVIDGLRTPVGAVQTPDNGYVVSNIRGGVTILRPDGSRIEAGKAFGTPGPGVAMTQDGRVFVVDYGGTTVREILPDGQSRAVADGLRSPVGLVVAPSGMSLLTAAWGDGAIYRIPIQDQEL